MQGYSDRVNHAFTYLAKHYLPRVQPNGSLPSLAVPANVALILVRYGAEETTVVASILHHLLEIATPSERAEVAHRIGERFGPVVLGVASDAASPQHDEHGQPLPWRSRKREVLSRLVTMEPRAIDIRCADEIHECGSAIATVNRLGPEYLESCGLGGRREVVAWYDDVCSALQRRIDWPSHSMRVELGNLSRRLDAILRRP
jgi:(p)ppGpp synthase/HD superfamily hydrolase